MADTEHGQNATPTNPPQNSETQQTGLQGAGRSLETTHTGATDGRPGIISGQEDGTAPQAARTRCTT